MSDLTKLTRYPERSQTDRKTVNALLDEVLVATISTVVDGQPWSIPTFFARDNDQILVHGSTGAGLMRHLASGAPATVTVHILDAIVVAETAFESSANYRSAVLRGIFRTISDDEKDKALRTLTDRLIPGRTSEVPPSTRKDLAATTILALPITPGSWIYKARTGPSGQPDPIVPDVWVGIVPMQATAGQPVPDQWVSVDVPIPASVEALVHQNSCESGPAS